MANEVPNSEFNIRDALLKIYNLIVQKSNEINVKLDKIANTPAPAPIVAPTANPVKEDKKTILDNEFFELDSQDTFLKLKANSFGIGKVQFAFVKFDKVTNKLLDNMDVYLSLDEAMLLAHSILSGDIIKAAEKEKERCAQNNIQYPSSIWKSPLGGISEDKAKARGLRNDGKAISRMFTLSPGSRQPYIFTAEQRPGTTDTRGLIVPDSNGRAEKIIRVPASQESLQKLALSIQTNINAYITSQYVNGAYEKSFNNNNTGK